MTNFERTAQWLEACGKTPGNETDLSTQIGCHLEEICEFLAELEFDTATYRGFMAGAIADFTTVANALKKGIVTARIPEENRLNMLKELCDCEVTGNGVAYLAGFDKVTADELVISSNEDKLENGKPVITAGGKIGKREGWTKPDLSGCI